MKQVNYPSKTTILKALYRAAYAAIAGALVSFAMIPVDLSDPKSYARTLIFGALTGALMGLQKLIKGYFQYDK